MIDFVLEEDPGAEGWDVAGLRVVGWGLKGMQYLKEVVSASSSASAEGLGRGGELGALDAGITEADRVWEARVLRPLSARLRELLGLFEALESLGRGARLRRYLCYEHIPLLDAGVQPDINAASNAAPDNSAAAAVAAAAAAAARTEVEPELQADASRGGVIAPGRGQRRKKHAARDSGSEKIAGCEPVSPRMPSELSKSLAPVARGVCRQEAAQAAVGSVAGIRNNGFLREIACVRRIGADDPRTSLRGQLGVFASREIAQGTVIPVLCPAALKQDYDSMHSSEEAYEVAERYAYEFVSRVRSRQRDEALVLIASLKDGCEVQFVNDARGSGLPVNVEFCELVYKNWPYLFLVAVMPIAAGRELLIDYGNRYWDASETEAIKKVQARLVAALQELRVPGRVLDTLHAHIAEPSSDDEGAEAELEAEDGACLPGKSSAIDTEIEAHLGDVEATRDALLSSDPSVRLAAMHAVLMASKAKTCVR